MSNYLGILRLSLLKISFCLRHHSFWVSMGTFQWYLVFILSLWFTLTVNINNQQVSATKYMVSSLTKIFWREIKRHFQLWNSPKLFKQLFFVAISLSRSLCSIWDLLMIKKLCYSNCNFKLIRWAVLKELPSFL